MEKSRRGQVISGEEDVTGESQGCNGNGTYHGLQESSGEPAAGVNGQLYTCRAEPDRRGPLFRERWSYSVFSTVAHRSTNPTRPATQSPKMSNSDPEAARKRIPFAHAQIGQTPRRSDGCRG